MCANYRGLDTLEFIASLQGSLGFKKIKLFEFQKAPSLQVRLGDGKLTTDLLEQSSSLSKEEDSPFWDTFITQMVAADLLSEKVVAAVNYKQPIDALIEAEATPEANSSLINLRREHSHSSALAVSSSVECAQGTHMHIPMLDLRVGQSTKALNTIRKIGKSLLPKGGVVLTSDRSYHMIGTHLMGHNELVSFLAASLLWYPIVDRHYIAHHLQRGWCSIRATAGGSYAAAPIIVDNF